MVAVVFTFVSVALIAWLALRATGTQAAVMLALVFAAGCLFAVVERMLARHFHQPFACAIAVFVATVASAAPFCVIMAYAAWTWDTYPGALLTATFGDAIRIGLDQTPANLGPLGSLFSIPFAYEAVKIWAVVQLKDYPIVAALFSIDSALYAFILARTGVVVTHLLRGHALKGPYNVE